MTFYEYPRAAALDVLTSLMLDSATPPRVRMECALALLNHQPEPLTEAYEFPIDEL